MAQDGGTSWWEKAAGHEMTMMGGQLKALLEMRWAEDLQAGEVTLQSKLTFVDLVFNVAAIFTDWSHGSQVGRSSFLDLNIQLTYNFSIWRSGVVSL